MHTARCGHAVGEARDYVEQAVRAGLREICFTDHQPLLRGRDPGLTMALEELPGYVAEVLSLREEYRGKIDVKLGLEADYFPDLVPETAALLAPHDWDLVLGSVHFQDGWGFDDPRKIGEWEGRDVNQVYRKYFEDLRAAALSGMFDVMAHPDLVKKFGHRATYVLQEEYARTAEAFARAHVALEVNTAGLRKPVAEIYPHVELLRACARFGVPVTVGADAHDPVDVAKDFEAAAGLLRQCGYTHVCVFEKRKVVERVRI
jgi:histidinol-phosphatase (PHP family)